MEFKSESIQLLDGSGTIVVPNGILVESNRVCAIFDIDEEIFKFISTTRFELNTILTSQDLRMKDIEEDERFCSECGAAMDEGFFFETHGTQYCSEKYLTKVIKWDEYLAIHDNGNCDAYWTDWFDC